MALVDRFIVIIPAVLSIVGMVLSALSLFAGHQQGFMEEYAIARVSIIITPAETSRVNLTLYS